MKMWRMSEIMAQKDTRRRNTKKGEVRYEDWDTNKHNEDSFDLISLSLHRSNRHSDRRIVKVEEDATLQ